MKSRWLIIFFAALCVFVINKKQYGERNFFEWDKNGYYLYLPAIFIYNDLAHFSFYDSMQQRYQLDDNEVWYIHPQPDGTKLNKYAVGTALFEMPFFLLAHLFCSLSPDIVADGYSIPYRFSVIASNLFWVVLGLFILRKFLSYYFNDSIVFITLLCIAFGTNIFTYTAFDHGMSHPYSFFLFAALMLVTHMYYTTRRANYFYALALCMGLITIARPVNLLAVIIPFFWSINSIDTFKTRIVQPAKKIPVLLSGLVVFICVCLLQMCYWKYATGHWVYFSYENEGFVFSDPEIWKGLFSYRKGWFIYTPIAFVAIVGFYSLWLKNKGLFLPLALFTAIIIYVTFSWYNWYYGGSFGCRPLIDILPVLALPLASLVERSMQKAKKALNYSFLALLCGLIALNMFQSYQYSTGTIPVDRVTKAYYWRIFFKTAATDKDRSYLISDQEYWDGVNEMVGKVKKRP